MKILITGGSGQPGSDCARVLTGTHGVIVLGHQDLDITDRSSVDQAILRRLFRKPAVII
jgi:dTDP-4-dehydrorhamnose reductase